MIGNVRVPNLGLQSGLRAEHVGDGCTVSAVVASVQKAKQKARFGEKTWKYTTWRLQLSSVGHVHEHKTDHIDSII